MNLERLVEDAYGRWRQAYGFFVINGVVAYALFAVLVVAAFLLAGADLESPGNKFTHGFALFAVVYVLALILRHAYLIITAYAGRKGMYSFGTVWQILRKRFVEVGVTLLLVLLALVTGVLAAQFFAMLSVSGIPAADVAGLLVLLLFLYTALRLSLAPYYAVKVGWKEAVARSLKKTREHIISVLLIEAFFAQLTVFLLAVNALLYVVVDAFFLAHIVNLTLFNLAEARR